MFDPLFRFDPCSRLDASRKNDVVALLLRLCLAAVFIFHGIDKTFNSPEIYGTEWATKVWHVNQADVPETLQFPVIQMLVAWGELLGGVAMLAGFLTRWAALGLVIIQAGAVYVITVAFPSEVAPWVRHFVLAGNVALISMCLALVVLGGGAYSFDGWVTGRAKKPAPSAAWQAPTAAGVS
jgi:putative oxidoreductase